MLDITFKDLTRNLTEKQRQALVMRYRFRWRVKRIALELGLKAPAVSRLLQRAQLRAGAARPVRIGVIRTKPRLAASCSLSLIHNI